MHCVIVCVHVSLHIGEFRVQLRVYFVQMRDEQSRVTTSGYIKTEMKMSINGSSGFPETASSQPSPMNPYVYVPLYKL